MSTTTQAEASRRNGSKSHGPTTDEGKLKSSRNATKHGLFASLDAKPAEMSEDFREALMSDYSPQTSEQLKLVARIVNCECRLIKISHLESSIYAVKPNPEEDQNLFYSRLVNSLTKLTRIEKSVLQALRETKEELQQVQANSIPETAPRPPLPEIIKIQNEPKGASPNAPQKALNTGAPILETGYPTKLYKKLQKRTPAFA